MTLAVINSQCATRIASGKMWLWQDGIRDDWEYQKELCTHHSTPTDVCPETLMKASAALNPCKWVLLPDPANPEEANCMLWACRVFKGSGMPFPVVIDPYLFCNTTQNDVVPRKKQKE